MRCYRRKIAFMLLIAILVSLLPLYESHEHTAEAAVFGGAGVCPQGQKAVKVADYGCGTCGGSGRYWVNQAASDGRPDNLQPGCGYITKPETDVWGTWTVYYRCPNCGVCKEGSREIRRILTKLPDGWSNQQYYYVGMPSEGEGDSAIGPGTVPLRWCPECGPTLKGEGETYKEGETAYLWQTPNEGYRFTGWSGGTVSDNEHVVTKDITITANFEKIEPPTPPPATPIPTDIPTPNPDKPRKYATRQMGDNVTFEFWDNGYLYVKGTGATWNMSYVTFYEFEKEPYCNTHTVIVEEGIIYLNCKTKKGCVKQSFFVFLSYS